MQFFNYVMRKVWLHQTRIGLSLYDVAGQGYLKESVKPTENIQTTCIAYILKLPTLYMYNKDYFFHIFFIQDLENYILELIPTLPQVGIVLFHLFLKANVNRFKISQNQYTSDTVFNFTAEWVGEIFLLILCVYCCQKILLFLGSHEDWSNQNPRHSCLQFSR